MTTEDLAVVGDVAHASDVAIHELRSEQTHLEELFFNLTESEGDRNRITDEVAGPSNSRLVGRDSPGTGSRSDATPAPVVAPDVPPDLPPPSGPPVDPATASAPPSDARGAGR